MLRWLMASFVAAMILTRCWPWLGKLGVGRLPGDVTLRLGARRYPFPFMSTLVITLLVSMLARLA
ncbi:Protein of unknown function DUF2905 [Burkholderia sp. lig30]|jgi:hypothetical protein|uniref:DUF2905 domain-containing protein n=1 Tax=Burkholderia sp. lig30 TaxID=1192124 RepID=UPI0004611028|nr:DUF2905 domain-containing protein [Burkholderia sp. lig30]KDB06983.1 Protein of unknown function DUF2905 [Burkholderia sp. lig30]